MHHIQLEHVWGGKADSAGTLRGTCALALVQCREFNSHRVLTHLTPLFADKELSVRVNVVRAVEQVGTDSAALLLRLRAELASDAPELLGACYSGVLALEGPVAIPWAAQFLPPEDDAAAEAAMAIAETHTPDTFHNRPDGLNLEIAASDSRIDQLIRERFFVLPNVEQAFKILP
jgi:hypothetical protein